MLNKVRGWVPVLAFAAVAIVTCGTASAADVLPAMPINFASIGTEVAVVVGTVLTAIAGVAIIYRLALGGVKLFGRIFGS